MMGKKKTDPKLTSSTSLPSFPENNADDPEFTSRSFWYSILKNKADSKLTSSTSLPSFQKNKADAEITSLKSILSFLKNKTDAEIASLISQTSFLKNKADDSKFTSLISQTSFQRNKSDDPKLTSSTSLPSFPENNADPKLTSSTSLPSFPENNADPIFTSRSFLPSFQRNKADDSKFTSLISMTSFLKNKAGFALQRRQIALIAALIAALILLIIGLSVALSIVGTQSRSRDPNEDSAHSAITTAPEIIDNINEKSAPCEDDWILHRGKCYYFSKERDTWRNGEKFCHSHNSSLAIIDNEEELDFLFRFKGTDNHWIGVRRTGDNTGWTWTNGESYNENLFNISRSSPEDIEFVYLNSKYVGSDRGNFDFKWICSKN